ncbi:hypothetical protein HG535_0C03380 [Zygotorulaspora mrakii]|uniref:Protein phosphatase methylesterase 1 n=1 Tax=Zygotorulaspora mrakii TaxID=42260 RepID=A0A7H9AZV9_ZYGMR|nr:uncharacterized protein HG535_0C03380 [Zygotorulaspora mrakii]QLG71985.1 hypothetical protein HG535_0C03380 [Zygotorulaspora mrakii]
MADDLRRKLILRQMGCASGVVEKAHSPEADERQDTVGDLPFNGRRVDQSSRNAHELGTNEGPVDLNTSWKEFFSENEDFVIEQRNFTFNTYYNLPASLKIGATVPVFLFHHGAGSSGLSFATLSKALYEKMDKACVTFAFDARAHGKTRPIDTRKEVTYDLNTFVEDFVAVVEYFHHNRLLRLAKAKYSFVFVGHSLGGSICTSSYTFFPEILRKDALGVVMLDIVEEGAILALKNVNHFLQKTPNIFKNYQDAIDWHVQNGLSRYRNSAEIAIPSLFRLTKSHKVQRITNLRDFEPFWNTWFEGLSHKFVMLPCSRLLLLAGNENLDKELIIGQMQGRYQLVVFHESGHFIQEDTPVKTALTLHDFYIRNSFKNVTIKSNWGSQK